MRLLKTRRNLLIITAIVLLVLIAGGLLLAFSTINQPPTTSSILPSPTPVKTNSADEPPLLLKSIGVNLDYFEPKTNKAGEFVFTKQKLQFERLFMGYGFVILGSVASNGKDKANPQPTF